MFQNLILKEHKNFRISLFLYLHVRRCLPRRWQANHERPHYRACIPERCITQGVSFTVSLGTTALSHQLQYPVTTAVLRGAIKRNILYCSTSCSLLTVCILEFLKTQSKQVSFTTSNIKRFVSIVHTDAVLSMNQEATVYAGMPRRRTEKYPRNSNLNHLIKMSHTESFRFTVDRNSFKKNQPNLISFRFVYFVSFIIILLLKFKSGITTDKQTNKQAYSWVSHKLFILATSLYKWGRRGWRAAGLWTCLGQK
jgi:hypothetical protein